MNVDARKKFSKAGEDAADAFLSAAEATLKSTERFSALNLDLARSAVENAAAAARAMLGARSAEEAMTLPATLSRSVADQGTAYARSLYDIANETRQELTRLSEAQYVEFQKEMSRLLDEAARNAPPGGEAAIAAMRNAVNTANAAFDTLTVAARHLATAVQSNISSLGEGGKKKAG